jgi:hypothetical protein
MSEYNPGVTDFTDAQYRAPIQTPPSGGGGGGIEWLPSMPFAGNGKRVCNEADPSWEEVITMVVIPGHPEKIREASGSWEVLFRNVEQARGMVEQVIGNVSTWEGDTATAFKTHMNDVSKGMADLVSKHRPVVQHLNSSADNLQTALDNTPIPSDMVDDVMQARQNFGDSGNLNVYHTGVIFDVMYPVFLGWAMSAVTSLFGIDDWVKDKLRDWISDGDDKAKASYKALAGQHVGTMDAMPKAGQLLTQEQHQTTVTPTMPPGGSSPSAPPSIGGGGGPQTTSLAGAGGLSGVGAGGGLGGLGPAGGVGGLAGAGGMGSPNLNPSTALSSTSAGSAIRGGMGGMPMGGMPMGGMAGAGGAGGARSPGGSRLGGIPSARTPGMGGLPMGGMAGAGGGAGARGGGVRGGGAGGAGGRVGGVGGMPMGGMGAGGAGAGTRGAGGGRAGGPGGVAPGVAGGAGGRGAGAGGRAGMAGMGAGAGAGSDHAADHTTWLEEDEDVWGTDSDAAPPVLG